MTSRQAAYQATLATVLPPRGYSVVRLSFQQWQAVSPSNQVLGTYSQQRYAANRCFRATAGLSY